MLQSLCLWNEGGLKSPWKSCQGLSSCHRGRGSWGLLVALTGPEPLHQQPEAQAFSPYPLRFKTSPNWSSSKRSFSSLENFTLWQDGRWKKTENWKLMGKHLWSMRHVRLISAHNLTGTLTPSGTTKQHEPPLKQSLNQREHFEFHLTPNGKV